MTAISDISAAMDAYQMFCYLVPRHLPEGEGHAIPFWVGQLDSFVLKTWVESYVLNNTNKWWLRQDIVEMLYVLPLNHITQEEIQLLVGSLRLESSLLT